MNTKKISVIIPCYNQAHFLNDALLSVLNQTYSNWECIIVNDGSSDNTKEVSKSWILKDYRFIYLEKENGGLSSARNFGISEANGEFILPLDADDKIGKDYLTLAIDRFQKDGNLKVVYCNAEKFGNENGLWILIDFSLFNLSQNNMIFCSAIYKKQDWVSVGGYDKNMIYGWEDWEFWISLLKNGGKVHKLEETCFYYRTTPNSMLRAMDIEKSKKMMEYLSVKHADFFVKYYGNFIELHRKNENLKNDFQEKLNSEKFVINTFTKKFFGFSIFKNLKPD